MKFVVLTGGMVMTAAALLNNDDDDETGVEFDATSSDFMKIKLGNTRVDPWGGKIQHIVLQSRLLMDSMKKSDGKSYQLGKSGTSTRGKLVLDMMNNKLAPSAKIFSDYMFSTIKENKGKESRVTGFDKEKYDLSGEIGSNLYPIYAETISETFEDQPELVASFLSILAFFGMGVNTYGNKKKKDKKD